MSTLELDSNSESKIKVIPPKWPKLLIEWPTVILFLVVMILFTISTAVGWQQSVSVWPFFIFVNSLCVYGVFTVMHEASHRNISRRFPRLEYFSGVVAGLMFHGSFEQFIVLHLQHHAKVNVTAEDPDSHAHGPITVLRLLNWCVTMPIYLIFYFKNKKYQNQPVVKTLFPYAIILAIYLSGIIFGFFPKLLAFWMIPSMLGVALTVYVFDHLPHHPHSDPGKYTNARSFPDKRIDWLLFMQSHHIVHHLWSSVPWYRYREAYYQRREQLQAAGNFETALIKNPKR